MSPIMDPRPICPSCGQPHDGDNIPCDACIERFESVPYQWEE